MDYPSLFLQNDSIQKIFLDKMSYKQATNVTQSKYKCDLCDYKTTKKELIRQHTLTKHSEVKHKCPNCAFTHYYSGKVRTHFQEVHLKENKRRDKKTKDCFKKGCQNTQQEDCEKLGHNKHVCKQCDYRAFTRRTIRTHIRNKHEGYLFSCNQCDFKNARNDAVNEHIARIHDGVVYRCERCDLVMTSKGSLKSHNYTHHSDKMFQCAKCNYKCASNAILNNHKRIVHSDKTFQCKKCIYKCANKSKLNTHTQKVHKTNFQNDADEN